ncbi:hypothetical protein VCHA37O177_10079 [Vibrio chagasii]|nr:hypothetical protein VCHA37O177_10079 [Vibrio chagasii]
MSPLHNTMSFCIQNVLFNGIYIVEIVNKQMVFNIYLSFDLFVIYFYVKIFYAKQ